MGGELLEALSLLADLSVVLWLVGGVAIGIVFGAAPGLTATAGVAVATPLTFTLDFGASMALLLGIYCGGYFAGSIPAILINTPGAPGNAATALDGYPMARRGEADRAIVLALTSSLIGGLISIAVLLVAAPPLARFALQFTSVEYFALALFGLLCVAGVSGGSLLKGIAAAAIGAYVGAVGIDPVSGIERLTFGLPALLSGVPLLPALLAFFAVTELLAQCRPGAAGEVLPVQRRARLGAVLAEQARNGWLAVKSGAVGTFIGMLPGTGPTIAAWIAYGEAARTAHRRPGETKMGEGAPRGVIAPEVANNAVTGGALVPLLTLGIPGDTVTAVLIGALLIQGIDPGPFFIREQPVLFVEILLLLLGANLCLVAFGLAGRRLFSLVLRIPVHALVPAIAVLCAAGGFAVNNSGFDVLLVALLGLGAYVLVAFGFQMAPLVLGLVLGPILETNLRNALTVHEMDLTVFVTRPISAALFAAILLLLGVTLLRRRR